MTRQRRDQIMGYIGISLTILVFAFVTYWVLTRGERASYPSVEKVRGDLPVQLPSIPA